MTDTPEPTTEIAVREETQLVNPIAAGLAAADTLGAWIARSGMFGCKTVEEGKVIAMTCVTERITPQQYLETYDTVMGRPGMKAHAMLAKLRTHGGDYIVGEWTDDVCSMTFTWKDKSYDYTYTMADAEKAGLIKADSGYKKRPKNMMFARCASNGLRAYVPELFAGHYLAEELLDDVPMPPTVATSPLITENTPETIVAHCEPEEPEVLSPEPEPEKEAALFSAVLLDAGIDLAAACAFVRETWKISDSKPRSEKGYRDMLDGLPSAHKNAVLTRLDTFAEKVKTHAVLTKLDTFAEKVKTHAEESKKE